MNSDSIMPQFFRRWMMVKKYLKGWDLFFVIGFNMIKAAQISTTLISYSSRPMQISLGLNLISKNVAWWRILFRLVSRSYYYSTKMICRSIQINVVFFPFFAINLLLEQKKNNKKIKSRVFNLQTGLWYTRAKKKGKFSLAFAMEENI